ncbi:MAG TPA: hypothetical protein VF982_02615, partial [Anaerolineales bacterium]
MGKPDIPQDVENLAFKLALEYRVSEREDGKQALALTHVIARAILAEREACAKEPEIVAEAYEAYGAFETANEFRQVAHAIRNRRVSTAHKSEN